MRIGDKDLVRQLMPDASTMRRRVKFWLTMAAVAVLVVVIARPQMGSKISNEKRNGIETIICLDISNSMLAQDVAPSRLDKSKMLVENLVDNFTNDKIGLVVFAGDAFVQLPITSDYVSAKILYKHLALIQARRCYVLCQHRITNIETNDCLYSVALLVAYLGAHLRTSNNNHKHSYSCHRKPKLHTATHGRSVGHKLTHKIFVANAHYLLLPAP
jgi:hypothetical protein